MGFTRLLKCKADFFRHMALYIFLILKDIYPLPKNIQKPKATIMGLCKTVTSDENVMLEIHR